MLAPTPNALAKALAGRDEVRLQPSGAYAANLLGLSEQVPARIAHLKWALPPTERRSLIKDIRLAPIWMHGNLRELAED